MAQIQKITYYDCVKCQREHLEGDVYYQEHISEQSKHGIKSRAGYLTTCQICGRDVKLVLTEKKTWVIAHHGYQRPSGEGWQSASCGGARYPEYETSCDRIKEVIPRVEVQLKGMREALAEFIKNPPETLTRRAGRWGGKDEIFTRPEDFDAKKEIAERSYRYQTYAQEFVGNVRSREGFIRQTEWSLEYLRRRLAAWKPKVIDTEKRSKSKSV